MPTEIFDPQKEINKIKNVFSELYAEIEKLRAEVQEQARLNGMGAERKLALQAKVERLREALEDIASGRYSGVLLTSFPPKDPAVERARAALAEQEPK